MVCDLKFALLNIWYFCYRAVCFGLLSSHSSCCNWYCLWPLWLHMFSFFVRVFYCQKKKKKKDAMIGIALDLLCYMWACLMTVFWCIIVIALVEAVFTVGAAMWLYLYRPLFIACLCTCLCLCMFHVKNHEGVVLVLRPHVAICATCSHAFLQSIRVRLGSSSISPATFVASFFHFYRMCFPAFCACAATLIHLRLFVLFLARLS